MESMTSSSVSAGSAGEPSTAEVDSAEVSSTEVSTAELVEQLRADRLWLLQQIDGGRWPELRLDLAALERELGQVLEQAQEKLNLGGNR
ncbi:MAG: hypothetical protein KXJ49_10790 [Vulcanococcus sp.]|jgi:hypothetical protein|uniref:hypothetical protein n=1 Tax=Vulcanococcus sp. TaxID=2856995 RepID=UPI0025D1D635|nr:hypothetical protein [Vulcanococcus sp.]MBW0167977.1 hypothetical protein [Vulcanococcus sp.]